MERGARVKIVRRPLHGVLLLDKPLHLSSNDALQKVKWLLRGEKAGHTGTLDPLATGVLPICFGAATKFSHIHLDAVKTYVATLKLGVKTSSGDAEGAVIEVRKVTPAMASQAILDKACERFTGNILQVPPMTSALKKDGKPLYELARQGIEVERAAREVVIHKLVIERLGDDELRLSVTCSKGTYIRTLGEDIGEALGCGGHLTSLRRVATGDFEIAKAVTLAQLEALSDVAREAYLLPVDVMLAGFERVDLDADNAGRFLSGVRRRTELKDNERVVVYGPPASVRSGPIDGQIEAVASSARTILLGSAHTKAGELIPTRLLSPLDIGQIQNMDFRLRGNDDI
ncbi:MAG: tRNA pseudouridine(55) synthase TruB [Cytophagales bacterium]|nr:tRNA pseudouridine(55) synthase TruB [Cytophagales bacterium]